MSFIAIANNSDVEAIKKLPISERKALLEEINRADPHSIFTPHPKENRNPDKRNIFCPCCGNGSGDDSTPVEVTQENGVWLYHCFKCDSFSGDLIKIIATEEHLNLNQFDDMCKALAIGANLIGYSLPVPKKVKALDAGKAAKVQYRRNTSNPDESSFGISDSTSPKAIRQERADKMEQKNDTELIYSSENARKEHELILADIANAKTHLPELPESQRRGILLDTYHNFGCGFLHDWTHPKIRAEGKKTVPTRRIIIPAGIHYNAVALNADRADVKKSYHKMHAGSMELFNSQSMKIADTIFIVEGEFDAMSIWQAFKGKIGVVAVLGAANWRKTLKPLLKSCTGKKFVILFDGDDAGRTNAKNLRDELLKRKIPAVSKFLFDYLPDKEKEKFGKKVDANDLLQLKNGEKKLHDLIERINLDAIDEFVAAEKEKINATTTLAPRDEKSIVKDFESRFDTLKYLQSLPQSEERDSQIIAQIRELCEWKVNRKGERLYILPTLANLKLIFNNDPNLQQLVGFDEFTCADVLLKDTPWRRANNHINREWSDKDDAQLRLYLREHYAELQGKSLIEDMVVRVSQANTFNVVKNYFNNLPKWDGIPRAETLFIKFLRVDDTPFAREVTLNWLLAAIARIFHPGCRYQTALVLHGNQKIGKSYIIERIGGAWYLELTEDVGDSHAADAIQKGWIIEIKEMSAMRKTEINAVKAFIERSSETRREAYARRATTTYRHCIFAITVNDSEFLRDVTGNRRYLILHCNSSMFDYVEGLTDEFIQQLWAEVYQKYNEMFDNDNAFDEKKLSLSREAEIQAEDVATHYLQDDGMTSEIKGHLDKKIPPQFIWQEFSREERRDFHTKGHIKLVDGAEDLIKRRRARGGKNVDADVAKISDWLTGNAGKKFVRIKEITRGTDVVKEFYIYGSEYRQHVCAAEIFNECFGSDKRKQMYRINEILSNLAGWHLGARLARADSVYPDQKKPFYRDKDNYPPNELDESVQNDIFSGEPIDTTDLPF
ncbi:MAG: toprim domain-containing protein [Selenomonadaceae bacterium]|nr:toprim domain-containing protein [Selenomonadaceae bacterium]